MIGAIIGDIAGSRFELNNYKNKDFDLFTKDCKVTDDSIMTLAVAKAIMETEKKFKPSYRNINPAYYLEIEKSSVQYMQEIGRKYPNCGYGGMFKKWVYSDKPEPYNSFGNGAAMRISPVGFAAETEKEVTLLSKAVTRVTHNHQEGIKGAEAVAVSIYMARNGFSKEEIRRKIESNYYPLDFTIDEIRDSYGFKLSCQETVPQAIKAFLESTSFEDAVRTAVSIGGDSDTLAAISGAIAESYYGVPADLKEKALTYLDDELRSIYHDWEEFYERKQVSGF
ncbi:ADP-ribosylglycohydrolase family protein [Ureibacillus sp. FSL K6-8385]|uniref:ADP-ribosylglycohydrolase family protein n=1 Tax=Ureibacillus TaxID=160795 RepID=UPI002E205826|nr:ADP-ribosylglycohydrolase family protein [Ureibacillus terrenus]